MIGRLVFTIAAVLAALFVATNGTAASGDWSVQAAAKRGYPAPHLRQVVRQLTRSPVRIFCVPAVSIGWAAGVADWESKTILLDRTACDTLRAAPRIVTPEYPALDSGLAVFTLTHEYGHVQGTPDPGQWEESRADCYAASHWRRFARALGFTSAQLAILHRQFDGGVGGGSCWGKYDR